MNDLFSNISELPQADHQDVFWYSKILSPTSMTESGGTGITPLSLTSGKSDRTYTVSYVVAGSTIYEEMIVRSYIEGPTSISTDGTFTAKLYPLSERTYSSTLPSVNSNDSNWTIGVMHETSLEAYTDPGDVLRSIQWDGSYYSGGTLKFTLDFSYSPPSTPLSFGLEWKIASITLQNL